MTEWAGQQQDAIKAVKKWLCDPDDLVFRLFGYAGTGKTTLAKHIAEQSNGTVRYAAFTGKAAHVLTTKGCPATTIHKLIYSPKSMSKARLAGLQEELMELTREDEDHPRLPQLRREIAAEQENVERMAFTLNNESLLKHDTDLLIVDECSMVDERMAMDLLHFGTKILVLGDPAQLPPVKGTGYFTNAKPNVLLTDVHRQAKDSPIIHLATLTRNHEHIPVGTYGDCNVFEKGTPMTERAQDADQVLCGRNKTRHVINQRMRGYMGFDAETPMKGDKMVCLRNDKETGLLNGQIWIATEDAEPGGDLYEMTAYNQDDPEQRTETFVCWGREPEWYEVTEAQNFDFAYALTTHKAQGSQWDDVVILDESSAFRGNKWEWLYTAITRAAQTLDVVKM